MMRASRSFVRQIGLKCLPLGVCEDYLPCSRNTSLLNTMVSSSPDSCYDATLLVGDLELCPDHPRLSRLAKLPKSLKSKAMCSILRN